jgi:hypothetical protein
VRSQAAGLPADLRFRTKGQPAVDVLTDAYADGLCLDFVCGDEVYGSCTELRQYLEQQGQAYVLRVASSVMLTFAGARMTCADAVRKLLKDNKQWEVRSAGKGSKGERWYAWAWIATASARRSLLVRRHLGTGELAFHYCFVPEGQAASKARLITAAGLRWPVEEGFEFAKDYFGLDQCQARLHTAIRRHLVLVMGALAICAVTAAQLRHSTATQTPAPVTPTRHRPPTPASSRCPPTRSSACSPPPSTTPDRPGAPPAGSNSGAATRHDPAGSTSAHASHAPTPWSASDWRLPAKASSMPVLPPGWPCMARKVRVGKNHSCCRVPACPNGASRLCPAPVPNPSSDTEKLCTRTCDTMTS